MNRIVFTVLLLFIFTGSLFAQNPADKISEANKLYKEQKFDQALNTYRDALLEDPKSPEINFNIGNTLYKKQQYDEALKHYEETLRSSEIDNLTQSKVHYNLGNLQYRAGKWDQSILSYKRALELNPEDMDAKYNLEFVRTKLKEQAQKQQNPEDQQQQGQEGKEQQGQQGEQDKDENKDQQQEAQGAEEKDENKDEEQPQPKPDEKKEGEMTREEAERLLNALKNDEKDIQKNRKLKSNSNIRVTKDW
ncbi:tetratricopeptide repeat protein [candidate division KSB1 bacterium]